MRIFSLLLATCIVTGCVRTSTDPVTGGVDLDIESPTKQGEDWDANLTSATNPSVRGTAEARVLSGQTTVTIALTGAPTGVAMPWHIHSGGCGSGGPIVGNPASYPPITVGNDGRATGTAKITVQLDEAQSYHVNVHQSAENMGTIIACGDLSD